MVARVSTVAFQGVERGGRHPVLDRRFGRRGARFRRPAGGGDGFLGGVFGFQFGKGGFGLDRYRVFDFKGIELLYPWAAPFGSTRSSRRPHRRGKEGCLLCSRRTVFVQYQGAVSSARPLRSAPGVVAMILHGPERRVNPPQMIGAHGLITLHLFRLYERGLGPLGPGIGQIGSADSFAYGARLIIPSRSRPAKTWT